MKSIRLSLLCISSLVVGCEQTPSSQEITNFPSGRYTYEWDLGWREQTPTAPTAKALCSIETMIDQHKEEFEFFFTKVHGHTSQVYGLNPVGKPDPHLLCTKEPS